MSKSNLKMVGNFGCYLDDDNVISFQIGDRPMASVLEPDPMFPLSGGSLPDTQWQSIQGFQVCSRGFNNMKCEEVASDIKKNRASAKTDYQAGQHAVWPWACRVQAGNRGRETSETVG